MQGRNEPSFFSQSRTLLWREKMMEYWYQRQASQQDTSLALHAQVWTENTVSREVE